MGLRENLHDILVGILAEGNLDHNEVGEFILGADIAGRVYFQPPETVKLRYPCIIYELSGINTRKANNQLYNAKKRYSLTLITRDPDTSYPDLILKSLQYCSFNRYFQMDNLNHYVFDLYY